MTQWWQEPQRMVQTNLRLIDADMDPRQVARDAKEFGATAIMFNVGGIFAWYPTKLPLQAVNPFLKDDLLGRMIEACRAEGLHFAGRFDFSKATQKAYDAHPEWFCRTRDGKPFLYNDTYQASITGGWFQEQGPAILEEAIRAYDLEAVFINQMAYRRLNYSHADYGFSYDDNAVRAFAEFSGGKAIPDAKDYANPAYREYLQFEDATHGALTRKVHDLIKSINPNIGFANGNRDWIRLEANRGKDRSRPEWQYQTGERARTAQSLGKHQKPYTVGVCHFYDFPWRHAAESEAMQMNRMAQALANGAEPHYYFMGPINVQEDRKPIEAVRGVFDYHIKHEELYTGLRSASKIGLYHSSSTERYGVLATSPERHGGWRLAFRGAYRALVEAHLAFDMVVEHLAGQDDFLAQLKRYDVIVLPDVICMSDVEAAAFDRYAAEGGTLLVTGETGTHTEFGEARHGNALKSLPVTGIKEIRLDTRGSYFKVAEGELDFLQTSIIMLDEIYISARPKPDAETYLRVLPPQRFGPPELCYPEFPPTDEPGLIIAPFEQGNIAFFPWAVDRLYFRASLAEHRQLLSQVIGRFTQPLAKVEGRRVELTVRRHEKTGQVVVHLINYSGQANDNYEDPVIQHDLKLGVRGVGGSTAKALLSGAEAEISAPDHDGYRWIAVPPVNHMEALVFEPGS